MVIDKKLRSCRTLARGHNLKELEKKAYLPQRIEYISRKNVNVRIYKPKEKTREIESTSSMVL